LLLVMLISSPIFIAESPPVKIESALQGSKGVDTSLHADHDEFEVSSEFSSTGFTIYVLRLTTDGLNVSGEASSIVSSRALGRFEIAVPNTGYAIGYSFNSFTALVLESKYLLVITPRLEEEMAKKVLQLALKAKGDGTLRIGGVYYWSPQLGKKLYYKQSVSGEILVNVNITLSDFLKELTIKAPSHPSTP
ncbi:MAG: hypothetical protein DRJ41_00925, partial [Thermoprotei archaeon]